MKKRGTALLLSFVLVTALAFSGCAGSTQQPSETPSGKTSEALPGKASPAPKALAISGEVVVSTLAGDPFQSSWRSLFDKFEQKTGVKVVLDAVPWENLREKQALELASGSGAYDVVYIHPLWFGEFTGNDYLLPVMDYCDQTVLDKFVPSLLDLYNKGGKVYGLPDWIATQVLAYRTDLFEKAGIAVPKTWQDILNAAEKLSNGDSMYGITFPGRKGGALAGIYCTTLLSNNGWLRDAGGNPTINTKEAVETAEFLAKLSKYAPPGYQNFHWDENAAVANSNKAAMIMLMTTNTAWLNDPGRSQTVGLWDFAAIQNKTGGGMVDSYCWSVAKSAKNKDAAAELVKYMADTDSQIFLTEKCGTSGATKAYYENEKLVKETPVLSAMNQAFANSKPNPAWNTWAAEQEVLETNLQAVFDGKMSAADAMAGVQAKMLGK